MAFNPPTEGMIFEILFESEKVADEILVNKQELVELDKRRQSNREAIRELKKCEDKNTWITVGSMLIKMGREEAISVLQKDQETIEKEINRIRNEQHDLLKKHNDLEQKNPAKGFDLKPMSKEEMSVLKTNLHLPDVI